MACEDRFSCLEGVGRSDSPSPFAVAWMRLGLKWGGGGAILRKQVEFMLGFSCEFASVGILFFAPRGRFLTTKGLSKRPL